MTLIGGTGVAEEGSWTMRAIKIIPIQDLMS